MILNAVYPKNRENLNTKDLFTRAGAGILYILVILLGILGGRFFFLAVFGIILGLGLFEFYRMVEKKTRYAISKAFNIISGMLIFGAVFLFLENSSPHALPAAVLVYLLILFVSAVFLRREDVFRSVIYSVFGQIYVTMPLSLLMLISYQYAVAAQGYSHAPVLALFVFIWVNDTAAYVIGSLIGKHKLVERISPKKSVEGFVAGMVFTVLAAVVFARLYPEYPTLFWMGFGLVTALFGTMGDLFESLVKRTFSVKDAGRLIPGHGGILDRIDSLLIAIPAVFLYFMAF